MAETNAWTTLGMTLTRGFTSMVGGIITCAQLDMALL